MFVTRRNGLSGPHLIHVPGVNITDSQPVRLANRILFSVSTKCYSVVHPVLLEYDHYLLLYGSFTSFEMYSRIPSVSQFLPRVFTSKPTSWTTVDHQPSADSYLASGSVTQRFGKQHSKSGSMDNYTLEVEHGRTHKVPGLLPKKTNSVLKREIIFTNLHFHSGPQPLPKFFWDPPTSLGQYSLMDNHSIEPFPWRAHGISPRGMEWGWYILIGTKGQKFRTEILVDFMNLN